MIPKELIPVVKIGNAEMALMKRNAGLARVGGKSRLHMQHDKRMAMIDIDQLIGQIGAYAGIKSLHGHAYPYLTSRWMQNRMPTRGDGGSDLPGANVDFKASLMRAGPDVNTYRLGVRKEEWHPAWIYVCVLVDCPDLNKEKAMIELVGSATAYVCGWCLSGQMRYVDDRESPWHGAYVRPVTDLYPMPPINWEW